MLMSQNKVSKLTLLILYVFAQKTNNKKQTPRQSILLVLF